MTERSPTDVMRALGVDLGEVRTGLALSDSLGITCRPLTVLTERDREALTAKIIAIAREEGVNEIVVGLPRPLGGGSNRQLQEAQSFASSLAERTSVPIRTSDERFTSKLARADTRRGSEVDAVAACHMLQSYLDACRSSCSAGAAVGPCGGGEPQPETEGGTHSAIRTEATENPGSKRRC